MGRPPSMLSRGAPAYERRRPERTSLYEVVRDNLETLYGAIEDGALDVKLPKHARMELEGYLDCGLLCRGFARLRCGACGDSRVVAWSCKGRGFCPSCIGRRMCATAANLIDHVLPGVAVRQWVGAHLPVRVAPQARARWRAPRRAESRLRRHRAGVLHEASGGARGVRRQDRRGDRRAANLVRLAPTIHICMSSSSTAPTRSRGPSSLGGSSSISAVGTSGKCWSGRSAG